MGASDVIEVLDILEATGVEVWLNGGWGVDALLGEQTRTHDDMDVFMSSSDVGAVQDALRPLGFVLVVDELPQGFVLRDAADRRVDFHPLAMQPDGRGVQHMLTGETWTLYAAGFLGRGQVGDRTVRCLTPDEAVREHLGYEQSELDHADMRLLGERFGIPLPPPFGPSGPS